jgi:hypothetical protein
MYRIDEAMLANFEEWAVDALKEFQDRFGDLRNRWLGH